MDLNRSARSISPIASALLKSQTCRAGAARAASRSRLAAAESRGGKRRYAATVSTVALVTVGALIGNGGLGGLLLDGFTHNFYRAQISVAAILCVALALSFDLVLLLIGRALMPWRRRRAA